MNTLLVASERGIQAVLLGLVAYLPFAYGGVWPLSDVVILASGCALAIGLFLRAAAAPDGLRFHWVLLPVAGLIGMVGLQAAHLPMGAVESLSPSASATWSNLVSEPNGDTAASSARTSLSLHPHATQTDLRLLLAAAVAFVAVLHVFRTPNQVRALLAGLALIGMAVVGSALVQHVTDSWTIFGIWEMPERRSHTGPFVHYGHFCQFVNLTLGAALALLLIQVFERSDGRALRGADLLSFRFAPGHRFEIGLWCFLALGLLANALSMSRNGLISMFVAGAAVTALLQTTRVLRGVGWLLSILVLLALVGLFFVGFDPVYERFSTLEDPDTAYAGRLALLTDTLAAWQQFPLFGIGQGAFELVFPMFDTSTRPGTAQHAENQYAELLLETGVLGFGSVLAFVVLVVISGLRVARSRQSPVFAAVFGIAFGLIAVAFHALTDFGLRIPAVAAVAIVLAGVVVAIATPDRPSKPIERIAGAALSLGAAIALALSIPAAIDAHRASQHWQQAEAIRGDLRPPLFLADAAQFDELLKHTNAAAEIEPSNVEYRFWAAVHHWHAELAKAADRLPPAQRSRLDPINAPELVAEAEQVRRDLLAARTVGPTLGPLWSVVGQLGAEWLDDPDASQWIRRGRELGPHHPMTCLALARQQLLDGEEDAAVDEFRRAIQMGARWQPVLAVVAGELGSPAIARRIAKGDPRLLLWLGRLPLGDEEFADEVHAEVRTLLLERCRNPDVQAWMLVALAREIARTGDDEGAITYYRRYLARAPSTNVRYELAQALERTGKVAEARAELQRILRLQTNHGGAKAMLRKLADR